MKVTLKKIGNSTGLILPKELLERLGYEQGDELHVTQGANNELVLKPTKDEVFADVMDRADDFMKRYRKTFEELAK